MSTSIRNAMKRDNDELYTPKILVDVIMPFVENYIDAIYGNWYKGKPIPRIWCPFDKENSEFVIALKEKFGQNVEIILDELYIHCANMPQFTLKAEILPRYL